MNPYRIEIVGATAGPHLLIMAGVHGDEYEPIVAVRRLAALIDRDQLHGKVTLVPIANQPAFVGRSRTGPDGLDLARTFPGSRDGTPTEQIAFAVNQLIEAADYLIDLHTGGLALEISPLVGYMLVSNEATLETQRRMAHAFGLPIVWGTSSRLDGRSLSAARDANVPAIYAEWGGGAGCRAAGVDDYVKGCLCVMAELNMIPPQEPVEIDRCVIEDQREASGHLQINYPAPVAGYYETTAPLDAMVSPGDELGRIYDIQSNESTSICSTQQGRLITRRVLPAVNDGDCLAVILELPDDKETPHA
ncbi:succinylglutamate desuccinylase/aspartoacylase family protein [Blastopirellula sp. JC732]|uniref:Succinylglutamate desuccinylase/aspartoacylase family protein n=1 Tax=Blastopirellula sediminis TaxID=2894196 RepID=A0A9X1MPV5_9BACT|nr:succinylglutamate desuccinylase/aspartoacylase family protein [Blastopirellula sediminis]MCC9605552.1 succinylglutamate desuccinylase/aspartoacylase family protein [Blastopirellula sediminis]MCC9631148.1 succinylglutamate desuccinylase/aspartoacylase family protein [Blastopirellula sediminis]